MIKGISVKTSDKVFNALRDKIVGIDAGTMAQIIKEDILQNFEKSKNAYGGKMSPLSLSTLVQKKKLGQPTIPLVATGQLIKSIYVEKNSKNKSTVFVSPRRYDSQDTIGTGKTLKRQKISNTKILSYQLDKNRAPFGISKEAVEKIKQRLEVYKKTG